jgi:integrase
MDNEELRTLCYQIAEMRISETTLDIKVYRKTLNSLFEYITDKKISPKDGVLLLSDKQVREITSRLNLRKKANRPKGKCLCDILSQLYARNLYMGKFPNLPNQIERKLILKTASLPIKSYEQFSLIKSNLLNLSIGRAEKPLVAIAENYFAEFLASAYIDGALWDDFHREVLCITTNDITFMPLTISLPLASATAEVSKKNAFFRYWLSPRTELYLLRLMLLLKKHDKKLGLHFDESHIFPVEWLNKEFLETIPSIFERWSAEVLRNNNIKGVSLGLRAFRQLCIFDLMTFVPPFGMTALSGLILCDSFDDQSLNLLDNSLAKSMRLEGKGQQHVDNDATRRETVSDEAKTLLEEGRRLLNSNQVFFETIGGIRRIIGDLSFNVSPKERRSAADDMDSMLSALPDNSSQTTDRFLLNVKWLGRWLAFLLRETTYEKATLERRLSMIGAKFIFMLGNNAIHELSTDMLVNIIMLAYVYYGSDGISNDIRDFTNHLYDYQDNMFPEMAWEALPWGQGNILHKEKIRRTKPLVSFRMIRDALQKINETYPAARARVLRGAVLLGFFAGLRIVEVVYLRQSNLILDGGYTLAVRKSKTKSGTRNINLSILVPPDELSEIISFFTEEDCIALTDGRFIFDDEDPEEARKNIPRDIASVFESLGFNFIRFHHLRHAWANWFIVRYLVAVYGNDLVPSNAPFLKEKEVVFNETYLDYIRRLFFGFTEKGKIGSDLFSYPILVLARLLGHYGPITTISSYLHIIDWICKLHLNKLWDGMTFDLNSTTVQDLMQVSYPALPDSLKKRSLTNIRAADITREQLARLKQLRVWEFVICDRQDEN